jgi:hypothetical protein
MFCIIQIDLIFKKGEMMAIQRYIGGGKVFFTPYSNGAYGEEREIGECVSANLSISTTYAEAFNKDVGIKKVSEKVATEQKATIKFETQNLNIDNMAMASFGEKSTVVFADGETLPNGELAVGEVTLDVVRGGAITKIEGKLKIISDNIADGKSPVLEVHHVAITPSGDIRDYFGDSFSKIGFEGDIIKLDDKDEYFIEYYL